MIKHNTKGILCRCGKQSRAKGMCITCYCRKYRKEHPEAVVKALNNQLRELLSPEGLELLPTIPKDLVAQHIPEQERDVVGSALWKPVYQGQPVNHVNNVDTDIDIAAISRGTIHLNPESVEFSLLLDPNDINTDLMKKENISLLTHEG